MKYWVSHLPLEVWVDVFCYPWIDRKQMGRIVDQIGNRKFAEYLQFYLHDWGKRTLKPIYFFQQDVHRQRLPQTAIPANINGFEYIKISHFGQQTIAFLHRISPVLLAANNIQLDIDGTEHSKMDYLRIILANLVPLLGPIDSLCFAAFQLPVVKHYLGKKLAKLKALQFSDRGCVDQAATIHFLVDWLTSPAGQTNIGPRFCEAYLYLQFFAELCEAIYQEFLAAKSHCEFAVIVRLEDHWAWQFVQFHLCNNLGEVLQGQQIGLNAFKITRYPANGGEGLEEWIKECQSKRFTNCHQIVVQSPTIEVYDGMDAPRRMEKKSNGSSRRQKNICCAIL